MKNIFPPIIGSQRDLIANIFTSTPPTNWISEDIEHLPFGEVIFWARRISTDPLEKPSQYSMTVFQQKHPELVDKTKSITEQYKAYREWRAKQPPEGDLTTPFGKRVRRWFQCPTVPQQFLVAYKTYGWHIVHKCKEIARKKQSGATFLDIDWGHLIRCRQVLSDLDHAMYSMEMHNAGAWDIDVALAQEFYWVEMLWFFAQQDNIDLKSLWSKYDRAQVRSNAVRFWWWDSNWDFNLMPDDFEQYFENGTLTVPLDGGKFVTSL